MLDAMLKAIGQSRTTVQIASLAGDSLLDQSDQSSVHDFVSQQATRVILLFSRPGAGGGRITADELSAQRSAHSLAVSQTREIQVIASYHPDWLLLHPENKREVWEHLKCVGTLLA